MVVEGGLDLMMRMLVLSSRLGISTVAWVDFVFLLVVHFG